MTDRFSFWLLPAEPARSGLRATIAALAAEYGGPVFEPHVTVISERTTPDRAAAAIARIAQRWQPIVVATAATGHSADRFKTLYVEVDDGRLSRLAQDLARELGSSFEIDRYQPHLSLLYRDGLSGDVRRRLAQREWWPEPTIELDTVAAMVAAGGSGAVERWQIRWPQALVGRAA